ncbi:MAG: hypothetical protein F9K45_01035 [Melioribacteraceae bacterium]|nr:MAG: hypothetical protein F9K45_01035 [Melioribacteraceae bacterium]
MNTIALANIISLLPLYVYYVLFIILIISLILLLPRLYSAASKDISLEINNILRLNRKVNEDETDYKLLNDIVNVASKKNKTPKPELPLWLTPYKFLNYSLLGLLAAVILPSLITIDESELNLLKISKLLNFTAFLSLAVSIVHLRIYEPSRIYWWEYNRALIKVNILILLLSFILGYFEKGSDYYLMTAGTIVILIYADIQYVLACASKYIFTKLKSSMPFLLYVIILYSGKTALFTGTALMVIGCFVLGYEAVTSIAESIWFKLWG